MLLGERCGEDEVGLYADNFAAKRVRRATLELHCGRARDSAEVSNSGFKTDA